MRPETPKLLEDIRDAARFVLDVTRRDCRVLHEQPAAPSGRRAQRRDL
ncbi:MAG: hypothetical protein AVDCRST_MAG33-2248 [uncultured Thermomicrobiales bacterium]|uniref:Uncharacterized protein n=1 Tax=uncultured Thermomicrobiales bacterium TaxID=1645740 RepID=A0A6J4V4B6_9BACT|nr:MAG: hypothetical protein AVDCRST_MAG33-2248 [uncultured Thermomicrobiales bacterium]